ncbi:hypothetical protein PI124_g18652 [Phytophthora idaei]|nr:hypothetical protein PI124_g18652 [Phytophthora idaei]
MVAAKVDEETAVRPGNIGDDTTEYLANLREALQVMHQTVVDRKWRKRLQVRAGSKGPPCNFDVGDYVLGSRVDKRVNTHKLLARCRVRSPRIKAEVLLRSSLNVTEEIVELISTQGILLGVWMFKYHRFNTVL